MGGVSRADVVVDLVQQGRHVEFELFHEISGYGPALGGRHRILDESTESRPFAVDCVCLAAVDEEELHFVAKFFVKAFQLTS